MRNLKIYNGAKAPEYTSFLKECNSFNINDFVPVNYSGFPIGFVHKDSMDYVAPFDLFQWKNGALHIIEKYHNPSTLTEVFKEINHELEEKGLFSNSHNNEEYLVVSHDFSNPHFKISRGAAGFWGIRVFGVHLNGLFKSQEKWKMWTSKRSKNRSAPGLLDHLVCGGINADLTIEENLIKEAQEEANIPKEQILQAVPSGMVSCWIQTDTFLNRFTPIIYDLILRKDFKPENRDGSVDCFSVMALEEIRQHPERIGLFKVSAYPVLINLLIRYGYIKADHPEYLNLCASLNQGFFDIINVHSTERKLR